MKYAPRVVLAVLVTALTVCSASAQPTVAPLTNADVTRVVAMGLPEQAVITLVNEAVAAKAARFDLSPAGLADLVDHKVPSAVTDAMRQPPTPLAAPTPPIATPTAAPKKPETSATVAGTQRATPPDLPPDPAGAGKWTVTNEKNPLNDRPIVTAMLSAAGPIKGWLETTVPTLVVRCQTPLQRTSFPDILPIQPGLEVYIVTGMSANVENAEGIHQLQVRFDDQPVHAWGRR